MNRLTKEREKEIRERCQKATEGPWISGYITGHCNMDHWHNGHTCKYDYTVVTDSEISHYSIVSPNKMVEVVHTTDEYGAMEKCDSLFIAHARTDIPALLAEVDALRSDTPLGESEIIKIDESIAGWAEDQEVEPLV